MSRRPVLPLAALACLFVGCSAELPAAPQVAASGAPTSVPAAVSFKTDVAPLIQRQCNGCHTAGGSGSRSLVIFDAGGAVSHANVAAKIADVVKSVESGKMPRNRPKLSAVEIGILKAWQAAGTPAD